MAWYDSFGAAISGAGSAVKHAASSVVSGFTDPFSQSVTPYVNPEGNKMPGSGSGEAQGGEAQGGGYNVDQITSQIQGLLDTGTDPAIEAEYQQRLGQGYRDAEMGAAARGVTGYGGLQKSKASVRRQAEIDRSRASMQQKQMNQQLAIQWTQQLLAQKQLTQEGALAMAEIQLGGADWIHENHPAMGKFMPQIQSKVAKYLEKNPNDYMGAATLYTELFNEALGKSGLHT